MSEKGTDHLKKWLKRAIWLVPFAYALNFIYALMANEGSGTFGDTFGAANALFSGTALLMLVLAVIVQREELEVVKDERNATRDLLEGQGELNALQKTALQKQSFEQSFFTLLRLIAEEKRALENNIPQNSQLSLKVEGSELAKSCLEAQFNKQQKEFSKSKVPNAIADCGTVCRLFTTAFYLLHRATFLKKKDTLHYFAALHAVLDVEIAHIWFYLSLVWKNNDPRSARAFNDCQGLGFLDEEFQEQAAKHLEEAVASFEELEILISES